MRLLLSSLEFSVTSRQHRSRLSPGRLRIRSVEEGARTESLVLTERDLCESSREGEPAALRRCALTLTLEFRPLILLLRSLSLSQLSRRDSSLPRNAAARPRLLSRQGVEWAEHGERMERGERGERYSRARNRDCTERDEFERERDRLLRLRGRGGGGLDRISISFSSSRRPDILLFRLSSHTLFLSPVRRRWAVDSPPLRLLFRDREDPREDPAESDRCRSGRPNLDVESSLPLVVCWLLQSVGDALPAFFPCSRC